MSIYAYSTHPPAEMKILPPLPERDEHESYETVLGYPEDGDGSLMSSAETETLQTVPDTTVLEVILPYPRLMVLEMD